jgi:hypothetical protein
MSNGDKETFESLHYGNRWGHISFGGLNLAGTGGLEADVLTGVGLQAYNSLHYIHMENDGIRKGWTMIRNPGVFEIKCADTVKKGDIGGYVSVENGDLVLRAPNGRIRIQAVDIDLRADGINEKTGYINIESNNVVSVKTGQFKVTAQNGINLFSPQAINIATNAALSLTSNFISGFTSASNIFGGKGFSQSKELFKNVNRFVG